MVKRWLIRTLFLLPLACVVGVWVTSYFGALMMLRSHGIYLACTSVHGGVWLIEDHLPDLDVPLHVEFKQGWKVEDVYSLPSSKLGFYFGPDSFHEDSLEIAFPLWLPTLLLAGLNWFVWRKTRAKYNERGFPVEPAKDSAKAK